MTPEELIKLWRTKYIDHEMLVAIGSIQPVIQGNNITESPRYLPIIPTILDTKDVSVMFGVVSLSFLADIPLKLDKHRASG